jgi:hypothetical protein
MTLILAVTGPDSIWMLADRRLTGERRQDDAVKIMSLDTSDGISLLGYAGLGKTANGTQPADWMSRVLLGRNLTLEHSINVLAEEMTAQLPSHMLGLPDADGPFHVVVIPPFVGTEPRLYGINLEISPDRTRYRHGRGRGVFHPRPGIPKTLRAGIAGSGAEYLNRNTGWMRKVLRLVGAFDRGRISSRTVADHLAKLNLEVHQNVGTVGPSCIVAWRLRRGITDKNGGQQFYTGTARDPSSPALPSISQGLDVRAICQIMMPVMKEEFERFDAGEALDPTKLTAQLNARMARLYARPPDRRLR